VLEDASFDNQQGGVEYHKNPASNFVLTDAGEWSTHGEWKKQAVWAFLGKLIAVQKPVFLVYPVPEVGWDLPLYNFATYLKLGMCPAMCLLRARFIRAEISSLQKH
jgi:hypothetical protein